MNRFDTLTKYISLIQVENYGEWVIDKVNDGTLERPRQIPSVIYTELIQDFIGDVYTFKDDNKDFELDRYREILEASGIEWSMDSMKNVDVSNMDAESILALIMGAVRAERFCDGALLDFLESGSILSWLERLKGMG